MPGKLTKRQQDFVREYRVDRNATQAAIRCGCSPAGARIRAYRWLQKANIQAAIATKEAAVEAVVDISKADQLQFLKSLRDATLTDIATWDGEKLVVRDMNQLPLEVKRAIESVKVREFIDKDGNTTRTMEFKLRDSLAAAVEINKMLGYHAPTKQEVKGAVLNVSMVMPITKVPGEDD